MRINDVDDWVMDLRGGPIERFYPTAASKATGVPLHVAFRQLLALANAGWLRLAYEVRCPQCGQVLESVEIPDPTSLYEKVFCCDLCGNDEVEATADNIFPVFFINEQWRDGSKKALAANGLQTVPIGGASSLREAAGSAGITILDFVAPELASRLKDLFDSADQLVGLPREVEQLREMMKEFPKNKAERRSWIAKVKELGETIDVWANVCMKLTPALLILHEILAKLGAK